MKNFLKNFIERRNAGGRYAFIKKRSVCVVGKRFFFVKYGENVEKNSESFQTEKKILTVFKTQFYSSFFKKEFCVKEIF